MRKRAFRLAALVAAGLSGLRAKAQQLWTRVLKTVSYGNGVSVTLTFNAWTDLECKAEADTQAGPAFFDAYLKEGGVAEYMAIKSMTAQQSQLMMSAINN
jgi:hypothetical protein